MEKDEKTTRDHVNCQENSNTLTDVERLTPDMIQAASKILSIKDLVVVIGYDEKQEMHVRFATDMFEDPPGSGVMWRKKCKGGLAGEPARWIMQCWGRKPHYKPSECPECGPKPYIKKGDPCE